MLIPPKIADSVQSEVYKDLFQKGFRRFGDAFEALASFLIDDVPNLRHKSLEERNLDYLIARDAAEHRRKLAIAAMESIPPDRRIMPAIQIAGPIFEGIEFEPEDTPLYKMWQELLARACDSARVKEAHPAFPGLIRQLSLDEVLLMDQVAKAGLRGAFIYFRYFRAALTFGRDVSDPLATTVPEVIGIVFADNFAFYMDHLTKLGLIENDARGQVVGESEGPFKDHQKVMYTYTLSSVGKLFMQATGAQS